uniref:Uncharacterized protein n=1 Tax=Lotharella globosa TaxID=91324 RepID=A0A7S3ZCY1_9EUKA
MCFPGNKLWKVSIGHKSRRSTKKGKALGKKLKIEEVPLEEQENLEPLVLSAQTFEDLDGPKIERKVSWGPNTYHLTHSGEDYDRTSWPDPYDNEDYEDDCTMEWWSSKYRPLGISVILIYVSLFILTVIPDTTSIL